MGTVHGEDLASDSNFPSKPPDLPGRLLLLVQSWFLPEQIVLTTQILEKGSPELERAVHQTEQELKNLTRDGILPEGLEELLSDFQSFDFSLDKFYVRNPENLFIASFLSLHCWDETTGASLHMTLDGETGYALSIELEMLDENKLNYFVSFFKEHTSVETGRKFLDRLGLESGKLEQYGDQSVIFFLADYPIHYVSTLDLKSHTLLIRPELDWDAWENSQANASISGSTSDWPVDSDVTNYTK